MKVFIWHQIDQCSDSYHSGGGVVVFAESEEKARALANTTLSVKIAEDEMPDQVRDSCGDPEVFVFPDAGCC